MPTPRVMVTIEKSDAADEHDRIGKRGRRWLDDIGRGVRLGGIVA